MKILAHKLLSGAGFEEDRIVCVADGRIVSVGPADASADFTVDYLTPGLIDVHCHGGEGFNARDYGLEQIAGFLDKMLASGVTDFLMTVSTGRRELMRHGLAVTRQAMAMQREGRLGGARILGAHLEGPFLSSKSAGAMQVSAMAHPNRAAFDAYFHGYEDIIRLVTLAPEEEGADELIEYLGTLGICAQAGHTDATFAQANHAFALGIRSMCHSFNGCRGIHHREPGVVVASMEDERVYMEAICDLVHLHPATLRLIYRMKGASRMMLISDSTVTHGLPDGEYVVEGYDIIVRNGVSRTASGALDGGGVYLDGAVRNAASIGIPLADAFTMATQTPAQRLGLTDAGSIRPGTPAHLAGWTHDLRVALTVVDDDIREYAAP